MNPLLRTALAARASVVGPYRRARLRSLARVGQAPVSVLFYHRVADRHSNPWTIGRDEFRRHIDYCVRYFDCVDLAEVQRRVAANESNSAAVSITFDDGYAENFDFAIPWLLEQRIPCTYFVSTSHLLNQDPFPHDVRAGIHLPVNTPAQIREAAEQGIEIGCHARTHVDFSQPLSADRIRNEIIGGKEELEQMIGGPVRYFAFPFGMQQHLTCEAISAVHQAGFDAFCSAFGGYNLPGRDAFHIRRFHGDSEYSRFVNWLSYDSRKLSREPRIDSAPTLQLSESWG